MKFKSFAYVLKGGKEALMVPCHFRLKCENIIYNGRVENIYKKFEKGYNVKVSLYRYSY